jgi:hypothetical protein
MVSASLEPAWQGQQQQQQQQQQRHILLLCRVHGWGFEVLRHGQRKLGGSLAGTAAAAAAKSGVIGQSTGSGLEVLRHGQRKLGGSLAGTAAAAAIRLQQEGALD